ncbi:MAG TPA: hypothetical protein VH764_16645 [Gemmatimonadales bacterium]
MAPSRIPHPLTLLVACILLAAALSWVLPAGEYQRREDPATGRSVVIPGTYRPVEAAPLGPFQAMVAIPRGMISAAAVFFVMGLAAGLLGGLRLSATVDAFVDGLRSMTFAALLIGFARGIYVVLEEGRIVDTIVHGLFTPIAGLPVTLSALGSWRPAGCL